MRTMNNISHLFKPLEDHIFSHFLPAIVNFQFSPHDRQIFSMPTKFGGLGIFDPSEISDFEYLYSLRATSPLTNVIAAQTLKLTGEDIVNLNKSIDDAKAAIKTSKMQHNKIKFDEIKDNSCQDLQHLLEILCRKGSSSWLTTLPLEEYGFVLNKGEFTDAICLRYNQRLKNIPKTCACGKPNSLDHALICSKGGFVHLRHNQVRDLYAKMLREVCFDVQKEPVLLPLSGEQFRLKSSNTAQEARPDVSARSVWNNLDKVFFDVRIFHHGAKSNQLATVEAAFKKHEDEKKRVYNQRIMDVEKATFTPLVLSTHGGIGPEAEKFNKRLAVLIAKKRGILYSEAVSFVRTRLRFSILRTVLMAVRGFRGKEMREDDPNSDINLIETPYES